MKIKMIFKSAKLPIYKTASGPVDRIGDNIPRPKEQLISIQDCGNLFGTAKNVIHIEQISNMLAVLAGERPVSTFHTFTINGKPIRKRINVFDEIAKNGYVKLSNLYYVNENNKEHYIAETSTFRKPGGSNSKTGGIITWRKLRNRFVDDEEKYRKCIEIIDRYALKPFNEKNYGSVNECVNEIERNGKLDDLREELTKIQCRGLLTKTADILRPSGRDSRLAFYSSDTYPTTTISLSGEFVFDVSEDIFKRIVGGKRIANYLDGGLVTVEKWNETGTYRNDFISESDLEGEGFRKVSDIDIR